MLIALIALACSPGKTTPDDTAAFDPDLAYPAPDPDEGFQMGIDAVAPATTEIWKCAVSTLELPETAAVHHVVSHQTEGVHHMDIMALSLIDVDIADGVYDCAQLYEDNPALMEDGVTLFASQLPDEELWLPDGVAAMLPPRLQIMSEVHYVNALQEDVAVWSRTNAYTMDADDVVDSIWGSAVRDQDLNIPPGVKHTEWTRCVMNQDINLIFISGHTHRLAQDFQVYRFDGTRTGELLYQNDDWHAPPLQQHDPPLSIAAGTGFEFRCDYFNDTDAEVHWGFTAADEMCQIGIVHTPGSVSAACEVVDSGTGSD